MAAGRESDAQIIVGIDITVHRCGEAIGHQQIGIVEIGDDAVALPALDAGQAAAKILFQEQIPRYARGVQVGGDARDDVAVVDFIAVKQQRDPVRGRQFHAGVSSMWQPGLSGPRKTVASGPISS